MSTTTPESTCPDFFHKKSISYFVNTFFIYHRNFSGLRAMNEPVLNTLRPLEEIEHESEEEDENNFDESAEGK